ncbi:MAG: hypothetical protein DBX59_04220 [Bacillota bacterium]|nr:MAG: hypothetical protein DBX59_04220 [Bacillota bacterium]
MKNYAKTTGEPEKLIAAFQPANDVRLRGNADDIVRFPEEKQLLDDELWELFVNQYRLRSDSETNGWRGEFWGKMMRGGCMTYAVTKNVKLYNALLKSAKSMLSAQDELGRFSTYEQDKEFRGWDMWCRKYAMLGLEYFYDICKNQALKRKIVNALRKHADYIVKRVGNGKNKIPVTETSQNWGGMNSCSILEPFVKLYNLTGTPKYLNFAKYIVKTGFCKDFNVWKAALSDRPPYTYPQTKAYEMMSCFEGLLEYYIVTKEEQYLNAVVRFCELVAETDITIIGCAGCTDELFDNSAQKQTEQSDMHMQETCVTVMWMKLNYRLLSLTGESRYADRIERSALNALAGAMNTENQTMEKSEAHVWDGKLIFDRHEPYPFDSYSPLTVNRRGRRAGGYMRLQNGRSYGCCACIGSAGTAIAGLFAILCGQDGVYVNLYNTGAFTATVGGREVKLEISANLYRSDNVKIKIKGTGTFALGLRKPAWSDRFDVSVDGEKAVFEEKRGYAVLEREWSENIVLVKVNAKVKLHEQNGKIALTKGPYVLARDSAFFGDIAAPVNIAANAKNEVAAEAVQNISFPSEIALRVPTDSGHITVCDYASAGKRYDDDVCDITVWMPKK